MSLLKRFFITLWSLAMIFVPVTAFAQPNLGSNFLENARIESGYETADQFTLSQRIGSIIQAALSFVGVIFMILTIYAGFLWMNARGDQGQVDKALDILRTAAIGLVIVVASYSITTFIVLRFL